MTTLYKGYLITTEKHNSSIYKNDVLIGCVTSDVKYNENNMPIYNSEDKAKKRIDSGSINLLQSKY